jgi:microcystin-dependent protein
MSDPFIGEIRLLPYTFAPRGWAYCNGQLLSIAQNTALFSILGTTYGGDGRTTFALPNLIGRIAMGEGAGPGLTARRLGSMVGSSTVTLIEGQLPSHVHQMVCVTAAGSQGGPGGAFAGAERGRGMYKDGPTSFVNMSAASLEMVGGGQPHANIQPFVVIHYCICMEGEFPSRN